MRQLNCGAAGLPVIKSATLKPPKNPISQRKPYDRARRMHSKSPFYRWSFSQSMWRWRAARQLHPGTARQRVDREDLLLSWNCSKFEILGSPNEFWRKANSKRRKTIGRRRRLKPARKRLPFISSSLLLPANPSPRPTMLTASKIEALRAFVVQ